MELPKKYLKDFEKACKVDIAVAGVTIGAAVTSTVFSFGLAAASLLAAAKAVADIAIAMEKLARDADSVEKIVRKRMVIVSALCEERKEAKKKNKGQKVAKGVEAAKEGAGILLGQISSKLFTTVSRTAKEVHEFNGKLSTLEKKAGIMYKAIEAHTRKFPTSAEGPDARINKEMKKAHSHFMSINQQYHDFNRVLRAKIKYGDWAEEVCELAKNEDYVPGKVKEVGALGGAVAGIATAVKVVVLTVVKFAR